MQILDHGQALYLLTSLATHHHLLQLVHLKKYGIQIIIKILEVILKKIKFQAIAKIVIKNLIEINYTSKGFSKRIVSSRSGLVEILETFVPIKSSNA